MKNYYQILGLDKNASAEDIKKAYRLYATKFHPDKQGGDDFFEERFKEIKEAYDVLSDETKRNDYDYRFFGGSSSSNNGYERQEYDYTRSRTTTETLLFEGHILKVTDTYVEIIKKNRKIRFKDIESVGIGKKLTYFWIVLRLLILVSIPLMFAVGETTTGCILCGLFLLPPFWMNMCVLSIRTNDRETVSVVTWNSEAKQVVKVCEAKRIHIWPKETIA